MALISVDTIIVVIIIIMLLCGWFLFKRRKLYWVAWQLPGPHSLLPLIGNGLTLMCDSKDLLQQILKITDPYRSPLCFWIGPRLTIFIKDPEHLQVVMQSSKYTGKSFVYKFLKPFMGNGLFTSSGYKHKTHRKLLQPLFGPKLLEGYSLLFKKHAKQLATSLESYVDNGSFDVLPCLHLSAFEASMDILVEDKNDHRIDYKIIPEYVMRFYYIFSQRVTNFWLYSEMIFRFTKFYKVQQDMVKVVATYTEDVTKKQIPTIEKRLNTQTNDEKSEIVRDTPSILEMMFAMVQNDPDCLTEEEFRDHMITFVATSQDTQSSAIAFTLMMLGMHRSIQDRVVQELTLVLNGKDTLEFDDLNKLKYMEMCLKESMRLFPLGPFLPRDVQEDFQLGKYKIPKGCSIILGIYNVHRDPKYWEKYDEFYPEHFSDEQVSKRHPYAYLPFSAGPRRCIALQYSYINMKLILSEILLRYVVKCAGTVRTLELMTDVSIRPVNGYQIELSKRI